MFFSYLVMNGDNFSIDRYWYILLNGILEIFSYVFPIPLQAICGRKTASLYLFSFTGAGLISISFLPRGKHAILALFVYSVCYTMYLIDY